MLRFGLLGTGYWAAETQAAGLHEHPDARFVGVWGRNPDKARALADRYGVAAYTDVDALIGDVDAVAMALPPDVQAGLAVRAARAGRPLLLEKPVALNVAEADAIVEALDAGGLSGLVFTTHRYRPEIPGLLGPAGPRTLPTWTTDKTDAFRAAVSRLVANAAAGIIRDPLDVHAGRDAVAVLAAAETAATAGQTVRLAPAAA